MAIGAPLPPTLSELVAQLTDLTEKMVVAEATGDARATARARTSIETATRHLANVAARIDPVQRPGSIFDPTDPTTAGRIVALTLVAQQIHKLSTVPNFYGAGIYAIYYNGDFADYAPLKDTDHPIYVGKADPGDASAKDAVGQGIRLAARLKEHANNIAKATSTIRLDDFTCRFLIVQTGFQKSAEDYLIRLFRPIWNAETAICFGLGKHGDSSDTRGNKRSPWDTMHPGRAWAKSTTHDQKPKAQIQSEISQHFKMNAPFKDASAVMSHFLKDMRQLAV